MTPANQEKRIFIPQLITTYALANWIMDNPKVYKEYLRRNNEIKRKIT